jgi:hypothetical protein
MDTLIAIKQKKNTTYAALTEPACNDDETYLKCPVESAKPLLDKSQDVISQITVDTINEDVSENGSAVHRSGRDVHIHLTGTTY